MVSLRMTFLHSFFSSVPPLQTQLTPPSLPPSLPPLPVQESLAGKHEAELISDSLPHLLDRCVVPHEGGGHLGREGGREGGRKEG